MDFRSFGAKNRLKFKFMHELDFVQIPPVTSALVKNSDVAGLTDTYNFAMVEAVSFSEMIACT